MQAPPGVAEGKPPTNPSSCDAVSLLGWPDLQQHYERLAADHGSVQHKSKGKRQQLEQAQAQLAPCPRACPLCNCIPGNSAFRDAGVGTQYANGLGEGQQEEERGRWAQAGGAGGRQVGRARSGLFSFAAVTPS